MKKVLVIEDDRIASNLLTRVLDPLGCTLTIVDNGPDGIALAMRERPNLILLDLGLPSPNPAAGEFDGFAVMRWLRRSPATRGIPVVVVTAWPPDQARDRSIELGAAAFVSKPVKPAELTLTVRMLIDDR